MEENKKSGFTLVELLAVIVIIGLIIIIALPKVMETLNNSKKRTFELTAKSIIKSAEEKHLENEAYGLSEEISCESVSNITNSDFSSCKIEFDNEGNASITLTGKGRYKGLYICNGTKKDSIVLTEECNENESSDDNDVGYNHDDPALHPNDGSTPTTGQIYTYGDYEYRYNYSWETYWNNNSSQNGWGVRCINDVATPGPILESINGEPVVNMRHTFHGCENLITAPVIPNGVNAIDYAFYYCANLEIAPVIPNGVTSLYYTFSDCTNLKIAPEIPNSVTNLNFTFNNCTNLKIAPEIPSSVTSLEYTFRGCTNLTTAPVIPSSITNMNFTFSGCTNLKTYNASTSSDGDFSKYVIPDSVTTMQNTFRDCSNLITAPIIPGNVTYMIATFYGCTNLTGTITINSDPINYSSCFYNTTKPITLVGLSTILAELAATATSGNVTVQ